MRKGIVWTAIVLVVAWVGMSGCPGKSDTNTPSTVPSPPSATATAGYKQVMLKWDSVPGATSYNLYWSLSAAISVATGTAILNVTSPYIQTDLVTGTPYYYIFTSTNNVGTSGVSAVVSSTPIIPQKIVGGVLCDYLAKRDWSVFWKQLDPISTMYSNGIGWARVGVLTTSSADLRNTPASNWNTLPWKDEYWSSLEYAEQIMREASNAGMRLNLFFFLSDQAANGGVQNAPAAWQGLSVDDTAVLLQDYCFQTTKYFKDKGLHIELYDIGNEIERGILNFRPGDRVALPSGIDQMNDMDYMKNNVWNIEGKLLKAAISGVKQADPDAKIVLHIAALDVSNNNIFVKTFFQNMIEQGVVYDYAGLSYPYKSAPLTVVGPYFSSIDFLSAISFIGTLGKKIIISEFDYPNSPIGISESCDPGYDYTPSGQEKWLNDFLLFCLNNDNIAGLIYFYPEYFPGMSQGSTPELESIGLFSSDTQIQPAMLKFKL
jgi:arabinogalactan endo-1,4-beta-galactosidase